MSCPICGGDTEQRYRPFCSKRCADVDLAKWMNGTYAVPSGREEDPEEIAEAFDALIREQSDHDQKKPH